MSRLSLPNSGLLAVCALLVCSQTASCASLDEAYDDGGPGNGRTIQADAGSVEITGSDGLVVHGRIEAAEITITGGADLAEPFTVSGEVPAAPGQVVVIDDQYPGQVRISDRPYDVRVAGVVAGAGNNEPGIVLTAMSRREGAQHIALTGVVYVMADASMAPIRPGDLLTTSENPGHAMRVLDFGKANGAVLGKALGSLDDGTGLVLMLISLL